MSQRISDLVERGLVTPERERELRQVAERFSVAITEDVAALIDPANPADPIAAQFVPSAAELRDNPEDRPDPIGDERHSPLPGIVHRYPDRVLLKPILMCPVYCRFCFRREQVGQGDGLAVPRRAGPRLFLYRIPFRNLGGDRYRRRSVSNVAAPRRRNRPAAPHDCACRGDPVSYAGTDRRAGPGRGGTERRSRPRKRSMLYPRQSSA